MTRHFLIVPDDPEQDMYVEHVGCGSLVTIVDDPHGFYEVEDELAEDYPHGVAHSNRLVSTWDCQVGEFLAACPLYVSFHRKGDPRHPMVSRGGEAVEPGRYEIEYHHDYFPGGPPDYDTDDVEEYLHLVREVMQP